MEPCDLSRAVLPVRQHLRSLRTQPASWAVLLSLAAVALYVLLFLAIALGTSLWLRLFCSLALGPAIAFLFRIAHDAGHGCHFKDRRLNRIIGRLSILPSYHPFSVWLFFHNTVHHGFTNLKERDYIWVPLSKRDYDALPPSRRLLARLHRTSFGLGLYYLHAIWWKKMLFPPPALAAGPRPAYLLDSLSALLFFGAQLLVLSLRSPSAASLLAQALLAIFLPFLIFTWMVGFVSFFNHTHPKVPWFARAEEWSFFGGQVNCTVHMRVPAWLIFFVTDLGLHGTHHIEPRIPIWRLTAADAAIDAGIPEYIVRETWSLARQRDILRRCKLYDYDRHQWLDFAGQPTDSTMGPPRPHS